MGTTYMDATLTAENGLLSLCETPWGTDVTAEATDDTAPITGHLTTDAAWALSSWITRTTTGTHPKPGTPAPHTSHMVTSAGRTSIQARPAGHGDVLLHVTALANGIETTTWLYLARKQANRLSGHLTALVAAKDAS